MDQKNKGSNKYGKKNSKNYRGNKSDKPNYKDTAYNSKNDKADGGYRTGDFKRSSKYGGKYDEISSNDISWWNKSPMYNDAVRVPFNNVYGNPINLGIADGLPGDHQIAVPGIMNIYYHPTIGKAVDSNSPVNRAFTSLYGDIYSKTTGAMQFQQADLALFVTGFSSIAMLIGYVKRALGVSQLYSGMNYYYPKAILQSMGIDPDTVIGKQDGIRMLLNDYILSFNNLKVPDFMDVYKRQYALAHNIYADEDDIQAQLFSFVPLGYYVYSDTDGQLNYNTFNIKNGVGNNINVFLGAIKNALLAWRNSSDLGIISGSIQRAFSDSDLVTLDYVNPTDITIPVMDRNILWQINNLTTVAIDTTTMTVTQDPVNNILVFNPEIADIDVSAIISGKDRFIINSFDNVTTDEFIMEATRLMSVYDWFRDELNPDYHMPFVNTEIVESFQMFYNYIDTDYNVISLGTSADLTTYQDMGTRTSDAIALIAAQLSKFRNGPRVELYNSTDDAFRYYGCLGDLYKFTTIDRETLKGLNETALQSVYQTNVKVRL